MNKTADELQPIRLSAREIPPPTSISAQARTYLSLAAQQYDMPARPALDDKAGWKNWVAVADGAVGAMMAGFDQLAEHEATELGGVPVFLIKPNNLPANSRGVLLDIHGGALVMGGGSVCCSMGKFMALRAGMLTYTIDYRMPPDHPYPAALDDCIAAYRALLKLYSSAEIIVSGSSAGGNLAAALMLRARDEGLPLPAGVVLLTPEVDLEETGDSFHTNRDIDVALKTGLLELSLLYANGHDLTHPYLSPLFGDFSKGFPPTFLQTGTRDLFLSNTVRMHRGLLKAKIDVELHVFEAMPHGGFGGNTPEDQELAEAVQLFVQRCLK
ncbi:MAG: esterase [Verrucomicrobiaceae bacterium]|nr:esterase [Verrucomicrobiaceae bacterium]